MKKLLLAVVLAGFGFMVGCGDEPKKPTTGTTSASPSGTVAKTSTAPPADTKK
jgi:hypothetical protein